MEGFASISLAGFITLLPLHIFVLVESSDFLSSYSDAKALFKVNAYFAGTELKNLLKISNYGEGKPPKKDFIVI